VITRPRALVLSPSATHPRDYGNRNRVWQTTKFLQSRGFEIHFVLHPIEDDWQNRIPSSAGEMRSAWTSFTVIPPSIKLHSVAAGDYHTIDEWWDPQIGHYLDWLFARQSFTVMLVNYPFLSKAFELAPGPTIKILETHDLFSGRREMLAELGVAPEFFYTTRDQEQIAFDRADIVVAIKESEARIISERTSREVVTLPFYPDLDDHNPRPRPAAPEILRVGFIGANNQVNVANLQRFLDRYARYELVYSPPIEIIIAGGVCKKLVSASPTVKLVGRVPDIRDFYDNIDVTLVPLEISTGIKIKTGEALGYGVPVVSTSNGFDGYPPVDEYHSLPGHAELCEALVRLAFDRSRLDILSERTRMAAKLAERRAASGFSRLASEIRKRTARIAIVTDHDIIARRTAADERVGQWIELCSHIAPTLLVIVGENSADAEEALGPLHPSQVEFVAFSPNMVDDIEKVLSESDSILPIGEVVLSIAGKWASLLLERLKPNFPALTVDLWTGDLGSGLGLSEQQAADFDLWAVSRAGGDLDQQHGLTVPPLRYEPGQLYAWNRAQTVSDDLVVVVCDPTEEDEVALGILRRRFRNRTVSVFRDGGNGTEAALGGEGNLPEARLFEHLLTGRKPACIIVIGSQRRKARLYRELARFIGIGFGRISCNELPYLYDVPGKPAVLCISASDAVTCACAGVCAGDAPAMPSIEGQWDTYWDVALANVQRLRNGRQRPQIAG
jgi:glycosyltransferase involved in cell wall biosynthesis